MSVVSPQRSSVSTRLTEMPPRKLARTTGIAWIITFVTSIPAVLLYDPLLDQRDFILGAGGGDARIFIGATLELVLIIANIATAVLPFVLFKRYSERLAVGYVTARLTECGFIAVGIVSVLAYMTLRQDPAGISADTLVGLGQSLVAVHDATFLLGPGFVVGVGNGLILGYLMYRSQLVPRRIAWFGLIGGPLVCISGIAVMFGAFDAGSAAQGVATIPEIIWEAFLGLYLTFKGFNMSSPVFDGSRDTDGDASPAIAGS
jgi:branched-subunit amino acid transport protein AzlD